MALRTDFIFSDELSMIYRLTTNGTYLYVTRYYLDSIDAQAVTAYIKNWSPEKHAAWLEYEQLWSGFRLIPRGLARAILRCRQWNEEYNPSLLEFIFFYKK